MKNLQPKDLIAVILILCYVFLQVNGMGDKLNDLLAVLIGYYFGLRKTGHDTGK